MALNHTIAKVLLAGTAATAAALWLRRSRLEQLRMDFAGRTVLIAGASRGLGLELARVFVAEGADVALLARDQDNLQSAAREFENSEVRVMTVQCDVSRRDQVRDAVSRVIENFGRVDVLVNNAGTIQAGPLENMDIGDYEAALQVHFWGPLYLMREIIPHMKAIGGGRIVNIASIGGKVAVPHLIPYGASKFALVGLSEGMRAELVKDGIYVTTVCPGLMRTGSHLNAFFKGQHEKEYALFSIAGASPLLSTSSEAAAREIVEACRYGKAEIIITPQARLLRLANGLFPNAVAGALGLVGRVLPGAGSNVLKRGADSASAIAPSWLTRPADRAARRNQEVAAAALTHRADDFSPPPPSEEMIDETLAESFPASDPPSWTTGRKR